jgi:addiction module RelE/StbE family toxin
MKEIRWSEEAVERLKEQGRYIAFYNPKAAKALVRRLRKKVQALKELPLMGRIVPELEQEDIREIIDKQYRIVYQVTEDYIEIITIFETRQLFPLKKKRKK